MNETTGELMPYSRANLGNFRLSLNAGSKSCTLRGSLHKYAHNGQNSTDFPYSDLTASIDRLAALFGAQPENFILHNVEFGVNLDYPVEEIVDNLLMYRTTAPVPISKSGRQRITGAKFDLAHYGLKLYGKDLAQLRLEAQVKRMQVLQQISGADVLTLQSLTDLAILSQLGDRLFDVWGQVFLRKDVELEDLKPCEQRVLELGSHSGYWIQSHKAGPDTYRKRRKRFLELQERYKTTDRKGVVARLAREKWTALMWRKFSALSV
ncbi:MAG: hypothetical protein IPM81_14315 [Saprospirales bacterium]|nr:hypothetical protein [Saprospirales bacterium]